MKDYKKPNLTNLQHQDPELAENIKNLQRQKLQ